MLAVCRFSNSNIRHRIKPFIKLSSEPISTVVSLPRRNELLLNEKMRSNFHTSLVKNDMESAVKAVGCGIAGIGTGTAAIGLGYVFGNLIQGAARNPSLKNQLFVYGILGGALCEALGLFAFIMGMMALFG